MSTTKRQPNVLAERTAQLQESRDQLQALIVRLGETEDRERRELAVVLHDDIIQLLAASKRCLETPPGGDEATVRDAAGARRFVGLAIASARAITQELGSQMLYEIGLADAVAELCDGFQKHHGLACAVEYSGDLAALSPAVRGLVFRTLRELLRNVARHAGARRVLVAIRLEGTTIQVRVQDDGRGIASPERAFTPRGDGGFGLFIIRERLTYLGGSMRIEAAPGGGCAVEFSLPV